MHFRRVATFVLGAWLAGSLIVLAACFSNVSAIEDVKETRDPEVQHIMAGGGQTLLKFMVAAEDSHLLSEWELAQAPLGLLALVLLVFARPSRLLVALPVTMLLLVIFEHVLLTPEITWLSQGLALGRDAMALSQRGRLSNLVKIYGVTEVVKWLLGMVAAISLFMMRVSGRKRRLHPDEEETLERAGLRP